MMCQNKLTALHLAHDKWTKAKLVFMELSHYQWQQLKAFQKRCVSTSIVKRALLGFENQGSADKETPSTSIFTEGKMLRWDSNKEEYLQQRRLCGEMKLFRRDTDNKLSSCWQEASCMPWPQQLQAQRELTALFAFLNIIGRESPENLWAISKLSALNQIPH